MKKRPIKSIKTSEHDIWIPTDAEFAHFKPIAQVDPQLLAAHEKGTIKKRGRPKLEQRKAVLSIRLDREVIDAMRGRGRGWQTQLNAFLYTAYVKGEQPSL